MKSHAVIILGMHRSGTSAMAGALNRVGFSLSKNLMPAADDNPTGFYESAEITATNDKILFENLTSWDDPRQIKIEIPHGFVKNIKNILAGDFQNEALWALKDPRISLFPATYSSIIKNIASNVSVIIMVRHPLDVARSIYARDKITEVEAICLWFKYTLSAIAGCQNEKVELILYDDLIENDNTLSELLKRIGINAIASTLPYNMGFISATHRHHKYNDTTLPVAHHQDRHAKIANNAYIRIVEYTRNREDSLAELHKDLTGLFVNVNLDEAVKSYTARKLPDLYSLLLSVTRDSEQKKADYLPTNDESVGIYYFTICAANYLGFAKTLAESLNKTDNSAVLTVFLLDRVEDIRLPKYIRIINIDEILSKEEFDHRMAYYNVLEFMTSVKPLCFMKMFDEGCSNVVYLDPDIYVFRSLSEVQRALSEGASTVLTPHMLTPLPNDQRLPEDITILRTGAYNLGFAAFAKCKETIAFLEWWNRKLVYECHGDPRTGAFTDQRWMDFAPAFLPRTHILLSPGYNVAYWNLHERKIEKEDMGWVVKYGRETKDLVFFHFSGFEPKRPNAVSKYQNRENFDKLGIPAKNLFAFYAQELARAGFLEFSKIRLRTLHFDCGICWDEICRFAYKREIERNRQFRLAPTSDAFLSWLASPEKNDGVGRYLRALFEMRPDVQRAFGDGRLRAELLKWLQTDGERDHGIDPELLDRIGLGVDRKKVHGVNYVAYFSSHLGVGEAARNFALALADAGMPVAAVDVSDLSDSEKGEYPFHQRFAAGNILPYAVTLIHCNADETPRILGHLPSEVQSTLKIGIWAWESPEFPEEWCDRFTMLDEIWVASEFMAGPIREKATIPVCVMPHVLQAQDVGECEGWLRRRRPEIPEDAFVFLFQFDMRSIAHRKNPEGAVASFKRAFRPDEPVHFLIKCINGQEAPEVLEALEEQARGLPISIWNEALNAGERSRLMKSVDAFVSLHRAEGFGLSIAEAMSQGKPVIATAWSGNLDFMETDCACLIPVKLRPLDREYGPYPEGTIWAEPDLDVAARAMRQLFEDRSAAEALGRRGQAHVRARLSGDAIASRAKMRIGRLATYQRSSAHTDRSPANTPRVSLAPQAGRLVWRSAKKVARDPLSVYTLGQKAWRSVRADGVLATVIRVRRYLKLRATGPS